MKKLCKKCKKEPILINGLCQYCFDENFAPSIYNKKVVSKMVIHGRSLKSPSAQNRSISKINKLKKRK